jgi:hypothetical protein
MWVNPLGYQEGRLAADVLSVPWLATRFAKCPGETANWHSFGSMQRICNTSPLRY